ncbi:helicase-associated domain-containing protein [Pontimonas sp.]|nr:helicase-associated domain-containing protein [Pontimonas sp.]
MPLPSRSTLELISWLAERDEASLIELARIRDVPAAQCTSLGDLAQALLAPENQQRALESLPRLDVQQLQLLAGGSEPTADISSLVGWGLVDGHTPPTLFVDDSGRETLSTLTLDSPGLSFADLVVDDTVAAKAAARGWATLCHLEDCLEAVASHPLTTGKDQVLSTAALKTLEADMGEGIDVTGVAGLALDAGLLESRGGRIELAAHAQSWLTLSPGEQWSSIVSQWFAGTPAWWTGTLIAAPGVSWNEQGHTAITHFFPLARPETLESLTSSAHLLGLLEQGRALEWTAPSAAGVDASRLWETALPPTSPGVFAHDDLTFLATGPVSKDHRRTLNSVAHRDLGGLVPRYRLSAASVLRALHEGHPADSLLGSVSGACANPLPHTMAALIDDTLRRANEVSLKTEGTGTTITTSRAEKTRELALDPRLDMMGLHEHDENTLHTSWPIERVQNALTQAAIPALPESPPRSHKGREGDSAVPVTAPAEAFGRDDAIGALFRDVREAEARGVPAGVGNMIDVAIEGKISLDISVEMPDASLVRFVMEPRALSGGRLRGVEVHNATERTLPVSRIRSLHALEA